MVYKTNSYAYLKFNKEVYGRTNIKFWAVSPLKLGIFLKNSNHYKNNIIHNFIH